MRKNCSLAILTAALIFLASGSLEASGAHSSDHSHEDLEGQKTDNKGEVKQVIVNEKDGSIMVYIPGGIFMMGNSSGDSDERPPHRVKLKPFYMDKFEITNVQYRKFVEETNHEKPLYWNNSRWNDDLQPVVGVSWDDAVAYAKWAGKHLPTEAEWELAARSTDGREYPWGNFWEKDRCNSVETGLNRANRVGNYPKGISPYGIYDMVGNVWEWCFDTYGKDYYKNSPGYDPNGPKTGSDKTLRGGSWGYDKVNSRASNRFWEDKGTRNWHIGFRCVRDAE